MGTKKVELRLETDQWDKLEKFRLLNEIETPSAAIRMLLEIGLRDTSTIEAAWLRAARAEGHKAGAKDFRGKLDKALGGLGEI